jgi:hypothetical protein
MMLMRHVLTLMVWLLLGSAPRLSADPWSLVECRPEDHAKYDRFAETVRTAAPGSTVYVPKPYPTIVPQVVRDFLYQYQSFHFERVDSKKLLAGEEALLQGVLQGTVTFKVQRIENWTGLRCGREQRRDFFHLVRVFDAASGVELSRATLNPSGLLSVRTNATSQYPFRPLPDPAVAMQGVAAAYGISGESPQYIVTLGTIFCDFTVPCLAFRQGSDVYIFHQDSTSGTALHRIAASEPRLTLKPGENLDSPVRKAALPLRTDGTEHLVPLGANTWTIAREVKPPAAPAPP